MTTIGPFCIHSYIRSRLFTKLDRSCFNSSPSHHLTIHTLNRGMNKAKLLVLMYSVRPAVQDYNLFVVSGLRFVKTNSLNA